MPTASVPSVKLHLAAAEALGVDHAGLFSASGMRPEELEDPEARVDLDRAAALIAALAERAPVPSYGLWLGEHFHPAKLSLVGYLLMNARTARDAAQRFCRFQRVIGDLFHWTVAPDAGGTTRLTLEKIRAPAIARLGQEWSPTSILVSLRILTGADVVPLEVWFAHPEPPWRGELDRIYRCPLVFHRPDSGLRLSDADLDRPVQYADPSLEAQLQRLVERARARLDDDEPTSRRVLERLLRGAPGEEPGVDRIAREFSMSGRSLQAALQAEGTTYRALRATARRELAEQHLRDPRLTVAEVSYLLGFSEPSAFHRAFKNWTGMTPRAFRSLR